MVAVTSRPALKRGVVLRKLSSREESYVIVKDSERRKYFKHEVWEFDLLELFDGTRSHDEIAAAFNLRHPGMLVDTQFIADYEEQLRSCDLLQRSERDLHLLMMEKLKSLRKRRFYDAEKSKLLEIQFPLFDPDPLLNRCIDRIRWVWSPGFVALGLAIFVVTQGFLAAHWNLYWTGFIDLCTPSGKGPGYVLMLIALIAVVSLWHEMGHAFTCKRFGGEVHDIGFMFFYLQPAFYCSVDDSYIFPKVSHRVYVTLGGLYFELMLCSAATAVWLATPAEWAIHRGALALVFVTGLLATAINANPLIKLDGYYMLMDVLDIPNLREESFQYLGNLVKRKVFRLPVALPPISRRWKRIFVIYGLLATAYTTVLLLFTFLFVRDRFVSWLGVAGIPVVFVLTGWVLRRRIVSGTRFAKHLWLDKREWLFRRGRRSIVLGSAALALLLLTVPRCPTRFEAGFSVEPGARAVARAPAAGIVRTVAVSEGAAVKAGDLLAVLEAPDVAGDRSLAASDAARAERKMSIARQAGRLGEYRAGEVEAREARESVRRLDDRLRRMLLTAPLDGTIATPYLEHKLGTWLAEGEAFCEVDDLRRVRLDVSTLESDIEEIGPGGTVRLLATAYPTRPFSTRVLSVNAMARVPEASLAQIDLVPRVNLLRVIVEVENPDGRLRPGMTGRAQFLGRPRSLAANFVWRLSRWLGLLVW
jgi:putative peptide zinc metalloprotease protein